MLFCQDGIVDAASFVPNRIALSSAESEYNEGAVSLPPSMSDNSSKNSMVYIAFYPTCYGFLQRHCHC
jgi:hypothetical protein